MGVGESNQEAHFQKLEEPQRRGDAAEAIIRAAFAVRGVTVLRPEHDNASYDFVVETDGEFYRIQAKTGYDGQSDGTVRFETRSTRVKNHGYERESYRGAIEYFAVYNPVNGDIYLVPVEITPTGSMTIRYEEPANGNWTNVNWHADYRLDSALSDL
ncbi:group I intron-associated PD-(D/E)XK endonuclease [Halorussus ruber]|uniref:group I intron-associated PD-(D/E)XK endonuclease n=1 Tax=Halorussus ruber TaxID=1126238 RepID=UPI0010925DDD|nr:group I intron-associated PD-(D/E)XK endonuclease [Halorussus ruber]